MLCGSTLLVLRILLYKDDSLGLMFEFTCWYCPLRVKHILITDKWTASTKWTSHKDKSWAVATKWTWHGEISWAAARDWTHHEDKPWDGCSGKLNAAQRYLAWILTSCQPRGGHLRTKIQGQILCHTWHKDNTRVFGCRDKLDVARGEVLGRLLQQCGRGAKSQDVATNCTGTKGLSVTCSSGCAVSHSKDSDLFLRLCSVTQQGMRRRNTENSS